MWGSWGGPASRNNLTGVSIWDIRFYFDVSYNGVAAPYFLNLFNRDSMEAGYENCLTHPG